MRYDETSVAGCDFWRDGRVRRCQAQVLRNSGRFLQEQRAKDEPLSMTETVDGVAMAAKTDQERFHLGFLWVAETNLGFVGGLLVTNHRGRPLEFQCTTPVKANRTQEILYGNSLKPFLFGELIGKTLCERISVHPDLIVVQQDELMELRGHQKAPVVYLLPEDCRDLPDEDRVQIGNQSVRFNPEFPEDVEQIRERARLISGDADLEEPLERVREALNETVKVQTVA